MQHVKHGLLGIGLDDLTEIDEAKNTPLAVNNWKQVFRGGGTFLAGIGLLAMGISLWVFDVASLLQQLGEQLISAEKMQALGLDAQTIRYSGIPYTVGALCIVLALSTLYAAFRTRYSHPSFWSTTCPACNKNNLIRIPRKPLQRVSGFLLQLPLCNYDCNQCNWDGIRINRELF